MGIIKMIFNKNIKRLSALLLGAMLISTFFGCDKEIVEPTTVIEMHKGYSVQLTASSNNVEWRSDNTSVATVSSSGLVTAVSAGKAAIYTLSSKGKEDVVCYLEIFPKRNILFYIGAGEGGIDDDAPDKIRQIREGWLPGKGEMIIYIDRVVQGACLLRVNETKDADGIYGLDTLDVYGAENSADSEVLSRVVKKMVVDYPADSYGMIFFSHGSGWLPEGYLSNPRSLVIDKDNGGGKTNREMEYYDFAAAIPDKQFDFIILEACLMADVMSMYELRNKAEYVLASSAEIVAPGFGGSRNYITTETYKKEIMRLYDTKNDIKYVVSGFAKSYYDFIESNSDKSRNSCTTLGVLRMDEMSNLASVTKSILRGQDIDEKSLTVSSIQSFDRPRESGLGGRPYSRYFDFAHVIENMVSVSDYKIFNDQMEKTVVWKASTKEFLVNQYGFYINHHSGLTTYIEQEVYPGLNQAYRNSSWYKAIR